MIQELENDRDTHDPTYCETCGNSGYVTQYIDGGRLIARIPCGCPQTTEEESNDDLPDAKEWWIEQKSWEKQLKMTYSIQVHTDISIALISAVQTWFRRRNEGGGCFASYCRQRCREYMLALRQHRNLSRREYL
jgi:hypothetical protein